VRVCSKVWNSEPAHRDTVQLRARNPQSGNASLQNDEDAESPGGGGDEVVSGPAGRVAAGCCSEYAGSWQLPPS